MGVNKVTLGLKKPLLPSLVVHFISSSFFPISALDVVLNPLTFFLPSSLSPSPSPPQPILFLSLFSLSPGRRPMELRDAGKTGGGAKGEDGRRKDRQEKGRERLLLLTPSFLPLSGQPSQEPRGAPHFLLSSPGARGTNRAREEQKKGWKEKKKGWSLGIVS